MKDTMIRIEGDGWIACGPEYYITPDAHLYCDPVEIVALTEQMAADLDPLYDSTAYDTHVYQYANVLGEGPNVSHTHKPDIVGMAIVVALGEALIISCLWGVCHFLLKH